MNCDYRFLIYLLKHKDGSPFRTVIQNKSERLIQLILCNPADGVATKHRLTDRGKHFLKLKINKSIISTANK